MMFRVFWVLMVFIVANCSLAVLAQQDATPSGVPTEPAEVYGSGQTPRMNYSGDSTGPNGFLFTTAYDAAYDDNPMGLNGSHQDDREQRVSAGISVLHETSGLSAVFEYHPYYEWRHFYPQYNRFNQTLSADVTLHMTSSWSMQLRDYFSDQTQIGAPSSGGSTIVGPTALNSTVYVPLANGVQNDSRADLIYEPSARTTLSIFGGYSRRSFDNPRSSSPLFRTSEWSGGAECVRNTTEHSSVGLMGIYDVMQATDRSATLGASRLRHSSFVGTVGWRPMRNLELQVFGGPLAISQRGSTDANPDGMNSTSSWNWTGGASILVHGRNTVLQLSGQHIVTDGGGLLAFVESAQFSSVIRRRLHRTWDISLGAEMSSNSSLAGHSRSGSISEKGASAMITRPIGPRIDFRIGYEYMNQSSSGVQTNAFDFHRNQVTTGLTLRLFSTPTGR